MFKESPLLLWLSSRSRCTKNIYICQVVEERQDVGSLIYYDKWIQDFYQPFSRFLLEEST